MRTRDEEEVEEEEEEDSSATTTLPTDQSGVVGGKCWSWLLGRKEGRKSLMSEDVCAFVIAITSVVQRRERERERDLGGKGGE